MKLTFNLSDRNVQYLIHTDPQLGKLIRYINKCEIDIEEDGFKCLVKYIIGQQISDKARETIWLKLCAQCNNVTPDTALSLSETVYRSIGLPKQKTDTIKALAQAIISSTINLNDLKESSNSEIISRLTTIKGIGPWTAEMFLIFSLGRLNVLSKSDGTIRRCLQWIYDLDRLPTSREVASYFVNWIEYSTIVSAYMWKAIALGITHLSFQEVIPD